MKTQEITKRVRVSQEDMPRSTLKEVIELAQSLRDNFAGQDASPIDLAQSLNRSPSSSSWRYLTGASVAYGLTNGAYNSSAVSLSPLGSQIVSPTEEGADKEGLMLALLQPAILKAFYEKYNGSKFPKEDIVKNVLQTLGVPGDRTDEAMKIVIDNARYVGVMTDAGGSQYIQLRPVASLAPNTSPMEVPSKTIPMVSNNNGSMSRILTGYDSVSVAEGRMFLSLPSELKDKLIDDEMVAEDWGIVRKALKAFADKYLPKA
jgi:hypothetical protein